MRNNRPWGYYEVLTDSSDHKVKRIVVYPGKRLSLQRHRLRREAWTIVSGSPLITRDNGDQVLEPGDSVCILPNETHRLANPGTVDVVLIEVQTGEYFGEDDIERVADDFGRAGAD